jgi:hypothetical protein
LQRTNFPPRQADAPANCFRLRLTAMAMANCGCSRVIIQPNVRARDHAKLNRLSIFS